MSNDTAMSGGCYGGDGLIICTPRGVTYRAVRRCPICKARTRHTVLVQVWYGEDVTCLRCGNMWSDGWQWTTEEDAKGNLAGAHARWVAATTRKAAFAFLHSEMNWSEDGSGAASGDGRQA